MRKKLVGVLLSAVMVVALMTGCEDAPDTDNKTEISEVTNTSEEETENSENEIENSENETENSENETEDTDSEEEADSVDGDTEPDIDDVEFLSGDYDTDLDGFDEDDDFVYDPTRNSVNMWELEQPDSFIEGETMTFTPEGTTSDAEWIEVEYTLGHNGNNQLKEITITSPDGTVYYPDELAILNMGQCVYGFHVGQGLTDSGEWTVTWTAKALIGEMSVWYEKDEFWQSYLKTDMVFDD